MANFVTVGRHFINLDRVAFVWDRPSENMTSVVFHWVADPGKTSHSRMAALDFTDKAERETLLSAVGATPWQGDKVTDKG